MSTYLCIRIYCANVIERKGDLKGYEKKKTSVKDW